MEVVVEADTAAIRAIFDEGWRAVGCDPVSPSVSGDHRQYQGAGLREEYRRADTSAGADELGDATASPQGRLVRFRSVAGISISM